MAEHAMGNNRGFTLIELIVTAGFIGVAAAVAIPAMNNALQRNKVITSAELIAGQIREARLAAITRNREFRVAFDCPVGGAIRMLEFTGTPSIDDDADRCTTPQPNDGPPIYLPQNVTYSDGAPVLRINGRGLISPVDVGATMPQSITVTYGSFSRTLAVSATGRVAISNEE